MNITINLKSKVVRAGIIFAGWMLYYSTHMMLWSAFGKNHTDDCNYWMSWFMAIPLSMMLAMLGAGICLLIKWVMEGE